MVSTVKAQKSMITYPFRNSKALNNCILSSCPRQSCNHSRISSKSFIDDGRQIGKLAAHLREIQQISTNMQNGRKLTV